MIILKLTTNESMELIGILSQLSGSTLSRQTQKITKYYVDKLTELVLAHEKVKPPINYGTC